MKTTKTNVSRSGSNRKPMMPVNKKPKLAGLKKIGRK